MNSESADRVVRKIQEAIDVLDNIYGDEGIEDDFLLQLNGVISDLELIRNRTDDYVV